MPDAAPARRVRRIVGAGVAACSMLVAACTNGIESASTAETVRDCPVQPVVAGVEWPADAVTATIAVTSAVYPTCVPTLVLATATEIGPGRAEADRRRAPLLVVDQATIGPTAAELERLDPDATIFVGAEADRIAIAELLGRTLIATEPTTTAPADSVGSDTPTTTTPATTDTPGTNTTTPEPSGPIWVAAPTQADVAAAIEPALRAGGGSVRVVDSLDPVLAAEAVSDLGDAQVGFFAGLDPTERWQLEMAIDPKPLPGGAGPEVFPDRRIVAFYGSPVTHRLGLLGEQGPQATIDRLLPVVDSYRVGDELIVPGFELIATVADGGPGEDGNYSIELAAEKMHEWVDLASANGLFVIIDLQPGRTDFLTQAKLYEEFLRLPNVGLALDPEWRLAPDQVHLRQIGTVDAAEVNTVVDYLVDLVHEEKLPQKILVLHQFQTRMITNRELIRTPPELAVVIHVDGQGPLPTKYSTWGSMLAAPIGPDQTLWWGWKNFLDEDFPMATPAEVNALVPRPSIVTFQ